MATGRSVCLRLLAGLFTIPFIVLFPSACATGSIPIPVEDPAGVLTAEQNQNISVALERARDRQQLELRLRFVRGVRGQDWKWLKVRELGEQQREISARILIDQKKSRLIVFIPDNSPLGNFTADERTELAALYPAGVKNHDYPATIDQLALRLAKLKGREKTRPAFRQDPLADMTGWDIFFGLIRGSAFAGIGR